MKTQLWKHTHESTYMKVHTWKNMNMKAHAWKHTRVLDGFRARGAVPYLTYRVIVRPAKQTASDHSCTVFNTEHNSRYGKKTTICIYISYRLLYMEKYLGAAGWKEGVQSGLGHFFDSGRVSFSILRGWHGGISSTELTQNPRHWDL